MTHYFTDDKLNQAMDDVLAIKDALQNIKITKTEKKMRKHFYKVDLWLHDGQTAPITVATSYIERVPDLIEKNKVFFERTSKLMGWEIKDTLFGVGLPEEQYDNELAFADIQDTED
jgi:hypothetical protein